MVLPTHVVVDGDPIDQDVYVRQRNRYVDAVNAGDSVGLEELVKSRGAFPVEEGDRLLVLRFSAVHAWLRGAEGAGLPASPGGSYKVRVVEGKSKGAILEVPARNLVPDRTETAKPKSRANQ
jgi:hypothetical protein